MDLPLHDYIGKNKNNITIRTLYYEDNKKCIMKISNCVFILEDNYNLNQDKIINDPGLYNMNVRHNGVKYISLRDFVENFIKHQKEKGWYCEIEYKSINYANIESGYNKFTPLSYFKDEYIITCSK